MTERFYAIRAIDTTNPYGSHNVKLFAGDGEVQLYEGTAGKRTARRICGFLDKVTRNEHHVIEIYPFKKGIEKAAGIRK